MLPDLKKNHPRFADYLTKKKQETDKLALNEIQAAREIDWSLLPTMRLPSLPATPRPRAKTGKETEPIPVVANYLMPESYTALEMILQAVDRFISEYKNRPACVYIAPVRVIELLQYSSLPIHVEAMSGLDRCYVLCVYQKKEK